MDFNEANDDTNTSVDLAARQGNVVLLKELLQQGHPTNGHNNRGWRPLHEAAAGGHVECVRLLLVADDAEVDALTQGGLTALFLACEPDECHTEAVKLLLHAGADPNMTCGDDDDDYLPLSKAAINNLYDIVKLLLDAGGNPNELDSNGRPLMAAVEKGHLKIAQLLVERGAKIYFNALESLLTHHVWEDSTLIPFVDVLVNGGLDVNSRMPNGATLLMLAIQGKKVGVVSYLLDLGADPNTENFRGVRALHIAIKCWPDFSTEWHDG